MKLFHLFTTFSCLTLLSFTSAALAQQVIPGQPVSASGTSGGTVNSGDCGYIANAPNHTIEVTEDLPYWRIAVQTTGKPTLLIQGPGGRYCVLPSASGGRLQFSGYGTKGTYQIFVGDRASGQHPYQLSISDKR
ncbi:MAG: hypothetical protein WBA77_21225 [Microcoleaceae cyanobacterium]